MLMCMTEGFGAEEWLSIFGSQCDSWTQRLRDGGCDFWEEHAYTHMQCACLTHTFSCFSDKLDASGVRGQYLTAGCFVTCSIPPEQILSSCRRLRLSSVKILLMFNCSPACLVSFAAVCFHSCHCPSLSSWFVIQCQVLSFGAKIGKWVQKKIS